MNFQPFNRYVLVIPMEDEEPESDLAIVLPDNYTKPLSSFLRCEVAAVSDESKMKYYLKMGDEIIIERRMLHPIEIDSKTIYLVLENYIYGRIDNEID